MSQKPEQDNLEISEEAPLWKFLVQYRSCRSQDSEQGQNSYSVQQSCLCKGYRRFDMEPGKVGPQKDFLLESKPWKGEEPLILQ